MILEKQYFRGLVYISALLLILTPEQLRSEGRVFYSTDSFQVTDFDLKMYLSLGPPTTAEGIGSRARVLQALSDLYALNILSQDALAFEPKVMSPAEAQWIADYEVSMEYVRRYLTIRVNQMLADTDWEAEALETYLADPSKFDTEESISLRTLLIRTDRRSENEAIALVKSLITPDMTEAQFEELVRANTEDEVARDQGGLMEKVRRGETVESFERAAFSLNNIGEISEPVVSDFGVHVIQLLERFPAKQFAFHEVSEQIIAELKVARAIQYRSGIQAESRERMPPGYEQNVQALDSLMQETSDGPLNPRVDLDSLEN